jgi:hypothetical protein
VPESRPLSEVIAEWENESRLQRTIRWFQSLYYHRIRRFPYEVKYWWQRRTRGFGDDELRNLDLTIAQFTLPRLKAFRNVGLVSYNDQAGTYEDWLAEIDEMVYAMQAVIDDNCAESTEHIDYERMRKGLELFGLRFRSLWD